jgi:hypothetical protein
MSSLEHSEIGLSFTTPFRTASHNLPTPPTSPPSLPKTLKRQTSRFRLPKILKRTRTSDSTRSAATETILRSDSNPSPGQQCSKYPEPSISASRTFHEMKKPFPLLLPFAPRPIPTAKDESLVGTTSRKLRKMPKNYRDLRAQKSDNQISLQPTKPDMRTPTLLPSPLPSDSEESHGSTEYFAFWNPRKLGNTEVKPAETSYDYDDIVAGYCEDVFEEDGRSAGSTPAVAAGRKLRPAIPPQPQESITSAATRTTPTSNMSATLRSPKRDRSSSLSSEATWLSKTFATKDYSNCIGQLERIQMNERRLADKSRRCCHLVQGPNDDLPATRTGKGKAVSYPETNQHQRIANHIPVLRYCHQARKSK